jgi:ATP-dependent Lon protease
MAVSRESHGGVCAMIQVLEELDAEKRLNKALLLIKKELELGKLQQEIQQQVRNTLNRLPFPLLSFSLSCYV